MDQDRATRNRRPRSGRLYVRRFLYYELAEVFGVGVRTIAKLAEGYNLYDSVSTVEFIIFLAKRYGRY